MRPPKRKKITNKERHYRREGGGGSGVREKRPSLNRKEGKKIEAMGFGSNVFKFIVLGFGRLYTRFSEILLKLAISITYLTGKDIRFEWIEDCEILFQE